MGLQPSTRQIALEVFDYLSLALFIILLLKIVLLPSFLLPLSPLPLLIGIALFGLAKLVLE